MKGSGKTPIELADRIAAVQEVGELYLLDRLKQANGASAALANGVFQVVGAATPTTTACTVPDLTIWLVKNITVNISGAGTNIYRIRPGYQRKQSNVYLGPGADQNSPGIPISMGWPFERPLILLPGDRVVCQIDQAATVTVPQSVFFWVDYYELSI
jgi:hypothetical protein